MKNGSAAREDLSKSRKSSATSVAIARKDNDSRSALGDQHPYEPSNIGIGHGAIDPTATRATRLAPPLHRCPARNPFGLNISLASFRRAIHSLGTALLGTALLIDGEAANWGSNPRLAFRRGTTTLTKTKISAPLSHEILRSGASISTGHRRDISRAQKRRSLISLALPREVVQ